MMKDDLKVKKPGFISSCNCFQKLNRWYTAK